MTTETKAKHTPGPWTLGSLVLSGSPLVRGSKGLIAVIQTDFDGTEANARLIAAAPDLLESAKSLLDILNRIAPGDGVVRVLARAAIAKATGEQP